MASSRLRSHVCRLAALAARPWLLAILALGLLVWRGGLFGTSQPHHAPGPVTRAHAVWETKCEACHVPGKTLSGHSWTSGWLCKEADSSRCAGCHAGPPHYKGQQNEPACAACHQEHRGREHDLARIADRHCLACHRDTVTSFESHPPFRNRADRSKLQFSHARHMTPGMLLVRGGKPEVDACGHVVRLECASCHQIDASGAYMLPVTYDRDCRTCHALTLGSNEGNGLLSPKFSVPHGIEPKEVRTLLEGTFFSRQLAGRQPDLEGFLQRPFLALPGKPRAEAGKVREVLGQQIAAAEQLLFAEKQNCTKCHAYTASKGDPKELFARGQYAGLLIEPPQVPRVWHTKARFSHAAHRALECRSCHENAYADGPKPSEQSSDVLIPGMDNCKQCHGAAKESGTTVGRASGSCVECHRYHEAGDPHSGRGSRSRNPRIQLGVQPFLHAPSSGVHP